MKRKTVSLSIGLLTVVVLFVYFYYIKRSHLSPSNHVAAVSRCMALFEDQKLYYKQDWDGDGVYEYASTVEEIGKRIAPSTGSRFSDAERGIPSAGYLVKILIKRGNNASGGELSYLDSNNNLAYGWAAVMWPAKWGETGNFTFIIDSNTESPMRKDLGPKTEAIIREMNEYDPDETWQFEFKSEG